MSTYLRIWLTTGVYLDTEANLTESAEQAGVTLDESIRLTAAMMMSEPQNDESDAMYLTTRKGTVEFVRRSAIVRISVHDTEPAFPVSAIREIDKPTRLAYLEHFNDGAAAALSYARSLTRNGYASGVEAIDRTAADFAVDLVEDLSGPPDTI